MVGKNSDVDENSGVAENTVVDKNSVIYKSSVKTVDENSVIAYFSGIDQSTSCLTG